MASDPRELEKETWEHLSFIKVLVGTNREQIIESTTNIKNSTLSPLVDNTGVIVLKDEEYSTVAAYLYFTRAQKISCKTPSNAANEKTHASEYETLAELYFFAEKFGDITLKNAGTDAILAKATTSDAKGQMYPPPLNIVETLFERTSSTSPLRKLLADIYRRCSQAQIKSLGSSSGSAACLANVVNGLVGEMKNHQPPALKNENYHEGNGS